MEHVSNHQNEIEKRKTRGQIGRLETKAGKERQIKRVMGLPNLYIVMVREVVVDIHQRLPLLPIPRMAAVAACSALAF